MNDTPLVSIIVPIYNASEWLTGSFRSFERQTYDDIEWILVDDGSADESADLCASWCRKDAARRRFIHKENGGASSARNLGLSYATGDYVMFWDADDEQDPSACQTMVESVMQRDDSAVVVCAIRRVLPDGSQVDLFTCDQHALTSEQALDEWFGGGYQRVPIRSSFQDPYSSITISDSRRVSRMKMSCGRQRFCHRRIPSCCSVSRCIATSPARAA